MAIALALSAALAYGSADFVGGLAARRTSPLRTAFGAQVTGLVVLLLAMPFLGASAPTTAIWRSVPSPASSAAPAWSCSTGRWPLDP